MTDIKREAVSGSTCMVPEKHVYLHKTALQQYRKSTVRQFATWAVWSGFQLTIKSNSLSFGFASQGSEKIGYKKSRITFATTADSR